MKTYQQQYADLKAQHPQCILLMRIGDFLEAFGKDAKSISTLLRLSLTQRDGLPMAGFPWPYSGRYIQRLLTAGIRVAIAEPVTEISRDTKAAYTVVEIGEA